MVRRAKRADIPMMRDLMYSSFGDRDDATSYFERVECYYVYEENGKLLAMTGLVYSKEYEALEVAWTCTDPESRGKGLMHLLFQEMLKEVDEPVYCSCWHLETKERINLYWLMNDFGFKMIAEPRVTWVNGHNCHMNDTDKKCVNYRGSCCRCQEDLYLREVNK